MYKVLEYAKSNNEMRISGSCFKYLSVINGWLDGAIDARNLCTLAWDTEESCLIMTDLNRGKLTAFYILISPLPSPFLQLISHF